MPATARNRPRRILPDPPDRSSVQRIRPRAPRTKRSAATPQANASGIAKEASSRPMPALRHATATAAGTTSTAASPNTIASEAR